MSAYIISGSLFLIQFIVSLLIGKKITKLNTYNEKIKEDLSGYIEEREKEYNLSNVGVLRLRILGLFTKITDEDEKEKIRSHMKSVIKSNDGNPTKVMLLHLSSLFFSALCIYYLLLFVNSEPLFWLSIVVNILVIFFWISRKRWIFCVLFGGFGFIIYPYMPAHLAFYLGLNMVKTIYFAMKKKSK